MFLLLLTKNYSGALLWKNWLTWYNHSVIASVQWLKRGWGALLINRSRLLLNICFSSHACFLESPQQCWPLMVFTFVFWIPSLAVGEQDVAHGETPLSRHSPSVISCLLLSHPSFLQFDCYLSLICKNWYFCAKETLWMLLYLSDSGTFVLQDHMCSDQVVSKIFLLQGFYESGLMSWIRLYELKIYIFLYSCVLYILVCFIIRWKY